MYFPRVSYQLSKAALFSGYLPLVTADKRRCDWPGAEQMSDRPRAYKFQFRNPNFSPRDNDL